MFQLRIYTLRSGEALERYAAVHWTRHIASLRAFGVATHGIWTERNGNDVADNHGGNAGADDNGNDAVDNQGGNAVSEDNGITWTVRTIPDSSTSGVIQEPVVPGTAQTRDPSVAIATSLT